MPSLSRPSRHPPAETAGLGLVRELRRVLEIEPIEELSSTARSQLHRFWRVLAPLVAD